MSERLPVDPEKQLLRPDDDEPDVEGHLLPDVEKAKLNPDADEPYEEDAPGKKA